MILRPALFDGHIACSCSTARCEFLDHSQLHKAIEEDISSLNDLNKTEEEDN